MTKKKYYKRKIHIFTKKNHQESPNFISKCHLPRLVISNDFLCWRSLLSCYDELCSSRESQAMMTRRILTHYFTNDPVERWWTRVMDSLHVPDYSNWICSAVWRIIEAQQRNVESLRNSQTLLDRPLDSFTFARTLGFSMNENFGLKIWRNLKFHFFIAVQVHDKSWKLQLSVLLCRVEIKYLTIVKLGDKRRDEKGIQKCDQVKCEKDSNSMYWGQAQISIWIWITWEQRHPQHCQWWSRFRRKRESRDEWESTWAESSPIHPILSSYEFSSTIVAALRSFCAILLRPTRLTLLLMLEIIDFPLLQTLVSSREKGRLRVLWPFLSLIFTESSWCIGL